MASKTIECLKFLESIKFDFFSFLKKSSPFFPSCCVDSSLILAKFIREYYGLEVRILMGKKKMYPNKRKFHVWLELDDNIVIDWTKFQFYIGVNKFKKVSEMDAYTYCIEEIQMNNIVFEKNMYVKQFDEIEDVVVDDFLKNYQRDIWDFTISDEVSPNESLSEYLDYAGKWLF